jgi:hypothetical protein
MQKEFIKLTLEKQRKFLIKNILKDNYFILYHKKFTKIFMENIFPKIKRKEILKKRNNYINNKITKILRKYKDYTIDLYNFSSNAFFYKQIIKQKNKLNNLININTLNYKDEYGFTIEELLYDVYKDTKNITINNELSLENIINNIKK